MERKNFLIVLFLLINILSFVNSQDPTAGGDGGGGENKESTTTTTTTTTPAATTEPPPNTTTTAPVINVTTSKVITAGISSHTPIANITMIDLKTTIQKPTTTKTIATTLVVKKTTIVKKYPQETYVPPIQSDSDIDNGSFIMYFIYVAGGVVSTILIGFATFTLYKKGFGDEAPSSRALNNSYEDDGYRNKSTISRNTLTPSIRNTTLGSPNSNLSNSQYR